MKSFSATSLLLIIILSGTAQAGRESGGGDEFTLDFVRVATQIIYPWLVTKGSKLNPSVDSGDFLIAVNPKQLVSIEHVFESCDGSSRGREVEACFSSKDGFTYLSRTRYPLKNDSPAKFGFISHEVFRKMGIEGNQYEISRQMSILTSVDTCSQPIVFLKHIFTNTCTNVPNSRLATDCRNSFNELITVWKLGIGKNCRNQWASDACMEACSPRMGMSCLEFCSEIQH